ncbi:HD domain-containing protein [Longispora fulva]|nr:HD domain-containing protein [Longispora fulva]
MRFIFETGMLKRAKRTGWWIAGVPEPESIADHSFRVGVVGAILAAMEGADPNRVALLGLLHDTQETRVGDIPHIGRRYVTTVPNERVTADQVAHCPPAVAAMVQDAVDEYEKGETVEALVAHDADKLECLVQAVEYRSSGNANIQPWIDSTLASLKTASAQQLAQAALDGDPIGWRNP